MRTPTPRNPRSATAGVVALIVVLAGCRSASGPSTASEFLLGTIISVTVHDEDHDEAAIEAVFGRVAEIEARMSTSVEDYDTTELLEVNRAAGVDAVVVSPDTFEVLEAAAHYSRITEGAFDVTIWPLVTLWGIGSGGDTVPSPERIETARALVDHTRLSLDPATREVQLATPGMGVDVGAIAKGYAADEAERILREAGVERALLDFGGNILVIGSRPDDTPWRIGVQRPDAERTQFIGIVYAADQTVVTSGPYERFFEQDGVRYHHILDPATGYPARSGIEQVTIIARRSMDADALSTSVFIMGLERGMALVESLGGVEAIFVTDTHEVHLSSGVGTSFTLTDERYRIVEEAPGAIGDASSR